MSRRWISRLQPHVLRRYGTSFLHFRSMRCEARLPSVATTKHIESQVRVLSGGEQAKVRLCKLINRETNILLLDEPTNHLDVDAKDELKRALKEYKGSILMVCHEPDFYDGLATDVWDCSKWTTRL